MIPDRMELEGKGKVNVNGNSNLSTYCCMLGLVLTQAWSVNTSPPTCCDI